MLNKGIETDATRNYTLDVIRAVSIFMVVLIHSSGMWEDNADIGYVFVLKSIFSPLINTAVPMFFMLSGALLLGKEEPLGVFLKKRFSRILLPFVLWAIFVYGLLNPPTKVSFLWECPYAILTGKVHGIYWFVYTIICLYLLTPILRPAFRKASVGVWMFGLAMTVFVVHEIFPKIPFIEGIYVPDIPHIAAYTGGFLIVRYLSGKRWFGPAALGFAITSLTVNILLNLFHPVEFPINVISAFGIFGWMSTWKYKKPCRLVGFVSEVSYGIYLSHIIFISGFLRLVGDYIPVGISVFVTGTVAFVATAAMLAVLKKCGMKKILF